MLLAKHEGERIPPGRGAEHNWHVWNLAGALEVLNTGEYTQWLKDNPSETYTINFANGTYAEINPSSELWQKMLEIVGDYKVAVFPLLARGKKYIPWTGEVDSCSRFDAIAISTT